MSSQSTSVRIGVALGCLTLLLVASPAVAEDSATVANKTFTVWSSQSFALPPFAPFQDCYRFTATTMEIDGCMGPGPLLEFPLFGSPLLSFWIGSGLCADAGLNISAIGTSIDGSAFGAVDALGGFLLETTNLFTFGTEGMADAGCTLPLTQEGNPYEAP